MSVYANYFGLRAFPFGVNPDPKFLYMMPHVREALACLQYGIRARKGFVVLTGEVGTGKTTLLRAALGSLQGSRINTAYIFNPRLDVLEFLEFVLTDFGLTVQSRSKSAMLLQLNQWLLQKYRNGETVVIVVDEAQNLSEDLLEEIRLLTNLETATEKLVQIVLSGQPELELKLRHVSSRQLRQRITLWCRTRALTREETRAYVLERLRIAGATEALFEHEALDTIYEFSRGIPRLINLLGEHSMITAYVDQLKPVPASLVSAVATDFDLDTSPIALMNEVQDAARHSMPIAMEGNGNLGLATRLSKEHKV